MKNRIITYKNSMVNILKVKYNISEFEARRMIKGHDFSSILKSCSYVALHDAPKPWAGAIFRYINNNVLLEM